MQPSSFQYDRPVKIILLFIIFAIVLIGCILALAPPVARDVLIHHLAIPKLWIKHGGFYEIPWTGFSYYPMNVDLLYLIPLYFGNDVIPNFIHMGFGLGTGCLIYFYLNKRLGRLEGLLGAAIFISLPIVVRMSSMAYVDLGLVFFTTASVLAMVRWRDTAYQKNVWLFISAISMGLALGTKYNALLAWFFLSLAVVFVYVRDTGKQWRSLQWGLVFFALSLLVFSPWLIKNAVLTGNPFYPLFKGLFSHYGARKEGAVSVVYGFSYMGMFKMREALYGETLWEILLIPVRFFLQGQDNTPRYFDGVLNPVLILAAPFAFINKKLKTDKLLFLCFAGFFIVMAFFLDQHRIRYILPSVPFVVILTVMGFHHLQDWMIQQSRPFRLSGMAGLACVLIFLFAFNAAYMKQYFQIYQPIDYLLQKESRDQYIARHDGSYPAVKFINEHTPENAEIRIVLLSGRGYYLERSYRSEEVHFVRQLVSASESTESFQKFLKSLNCTHLLIRHDLFEQFVASNYTPSQADQLFEMIEENMKMLFRDRSCAVFQLVL